MNAHDIHSARDGVIEKSEGSRGGHIIGHTKSGKPVYGPSSGHYAKTRGHLEHMSTSSPIDHTHRMAAKEVIDAHKGWSAADHRDAGMLHKLFHDVAAAVPGSDSQKEAAGHVAFAHQKAAKLMEKGGVSFQALSSLERLTDLAKAEGARGGHIIGHTRSGRAIYAAKGTKRELLHKLDHGMNHVSVASSLKHKHYIGMTSHDHMARAAKHQAQAVKKYRAARRAGTVEEALKSHRLGNQHMSLSRAHAMMGQLGAEVRTPDHIRDAAAMGAGGAVDKIRLDQAKERYFSTLGKAGHQRALTRHTRLKNEAVAANHVKTAEHHTMMANAHKAILDHHY